MAEPDNADRARMNEGTDPGDTEQNSTEAGNTEPGAAEAGNTEPGAAEYDNTDGARAATGGSERKGPVRSAPLRRKRRPPARSADEWTDAPGTADLSDDTPGTSEVVTPVDPDPAAAPDPAPPEPEPEAVERELSYRERRNRRMSSTPAAGAGRGVRYRGSRTRSASTIAAVSVCAVLLVASIVAAAVFATGIGRIRDQQELREEYSGFAQQMVVNLTSLNAGNVDDAMKTLEDKTSGRAHQQMQESMKQAVSLVRDQNLETKSTVLSDAVTQSTPDEGTVILVYGWQMKPENPKEQTIVQTFRWRVQITRINGELKMTNFEWVT